MKSRLFIRALCVGAALLVPAGGLTTLGITTAGATTNQLLLLKTSTASLGGLGKAILSTLQCTMTATQCTVTSQITITKSGTKTIKLLPVTFKILVTQSSTNLVITAIAIKKSSFVLKNTSFTHCKISTVPATALSHTGTLWKASGVSMSGVTIGTTGGTCTKKSTLTADFGTNLSVNFQTVTTKPKA